MKYLVFIMSFLILMIMGAHGQKIQNNINVSQSGETDNKFIVVEKCEAYRVPGSGIYSNKRAKVVAIVKLRNVSDSGTKIIANSKQYNDIDIIHEYSVDCDRKMIIGIPYHQAKRWNKDEMKESARLDAAYIEKGEVVYISIQKSECRGVPKKKEEIKNGYITGRITVIKGNRFIDNSISCDF